MSLLLSKSSVESSPNTSPFLAFAGGFGSSKGGGAKKKGNKKTKPRKGGLSGLTTKEPTIQSNEEKISSTATTTPKLDKWGLPELTEEDLFPPMPPGTELIPCNPSKDYTLKEIQDCLKDHLDLKLDRFFDENRREKTDRKSPMQLRLLHESPPVLSIDNFFTPEECQVVKETAHATPTRAMLLLLIWQRARFAKRGGQPPQGQTIKGSFPMF